MNTYSLSSRSFKILETLPIEKDFEFIVDGQHYPTFKIIAVALSPSLAQKLKKYPTLESVTLPLKDPHHQFPLVFDMIFNHSDFQVTEDNFLFLYKVGELFDNQDIIELALQPQFLVFSPTKISKILAQCYEIDDKIYYPDAVKYAAENIESIYSLNEFQNLPIKVLQDIFNNPNYKWNSLSYKELSHINKSRTDFTFIFKSICYNHFEEIQPNFLTSFADYITDDDFPYAEESIKNALIRFSA